MIVHATSADLTAWLPTGSTVDDADRLLERASALVDQHVRASYDVDATGAATGTDVLEALKVATCATVEAWLEIGEENDLDGLAGTHMSVPGYSGLRATELPPRAYRALSQANLLHPSDVGVCW